MEKDTPETDETTASSTDIAPTMQVSIAYATMLPAKENESRRTARTASAHVSLWTHFKDVLRDSKNFVQNDRGVTNLSMTIILNMTGLLALCVFVSCAFAAADASLAYLMTDKIILGASALVLIFTTLLLANQGEIADETLRSRVNKVAPVFLMVSAPVLIGVAAILHLANVISLSSLLLPSIATLFSLVAVHKSHRHAPFLKKQTVLSFAIVSSLMMLVLARFAFAESVAALSDKSEINTIVNSLLTCFY